jgi:hypothetical protein
MSTEFPIPRISTPWLADSCPSRWHYPPSLMCGQLAPLIGVSDFAISKCRDFVSMKSPICRSPTFFGSPTRVLNGWTVQVKPQTSPNANPKALICVGPDGSNADDSPMVATFPNQMDSSDCIGVFTMDFSTPCSQNSRCVDSLQISATCLTLMDGPDRISLFRDLKCPDFLDLVNPDFTNADNPMPSHLSSGFLLLSSQT